MSWDEVGQSLEDAIKAAIEPLVDAAGEDRIAGFGVHIDADNGGMIGLYLLPERAARSLAPDLLDNLGDWPTSTDWDDEASYSKAFMAYWGPWAEWFGQGTSDPEEAGEWNRELLRLACLAVRHAREEGYFDGFEQCDPFRVIIAAHDEPDELSRERFGHFLETGEVRVMDDVYEE